MARKRGTKPSHAGPAKENSCTALGGGNGVKGEEDARINVADEQHAQMPKDITTATRSDAKPRAATGGPTGDSGCADGADGQVSAAHRMAASEAFVTAGYELTALHSILVRLGPESPHAGQILERIFQAEMSRLKEDGAQYMETLSVSAAAPVTVTENSPRDGSAPGTASITSGAPAAELTADAERTAEKAVSQLDEDGAQCVETASFIASTSGIGPLFSGIDFSADKFGHLQGLVEYACPVQPGRPPKRTLRDDLDDPAADIPGTTPSIPAFLANAAARRGREC